MFMNSNIPLLRWLESKGITLNDLIETALEIFFPHPGVETKEEATKLLREEFINALSDVNVACLVIACALLEEEAYKGNVPGLTKEFLEGPGLVADELMGMIISCYIAGARGIFEFVRFDQKKPGILKKLGPVLNDAIGGLISGASSNMYTRALLKARKRSS